MNAILERLKAATGPMGVVERQDLAYAAGFRGENYALMCAALRGELDAVGAALALVDEMLPGWFYTLASCHTDYGMLPWAEVAEPDVITDGGGDSFDAACATPALAILTALFTAIATKENQT